MTDEPRWCLHCQTNVIPATVRKNVLYCGARCRRGARKAKQATKRQKERLRLITQGPNPRELLMFRECGDQLRSSGPRNAIGYRVVLFRPNTEPREFPEPGKTKHLSVEREWIALDYFELRPTYEWARVPLTGQYQVIFIGPGGIPFSDPKWLQLYIQLPASPMSDEWRSARWGNKRQEPF